MKKIIIADQIKHSLERETNFLQWSNIKVFTAYSNEEVLKIHGTEKVDLIITLFHLPCMSTADLFPDKDNSESAQRLDDHLLL